MADKEIKLEDIDYEKYDFLDMGCGTADGYYHVKKLFGKHKGLGIDIDENKIDEANEVISKNKELKENYLAICDDVLNFSKLKLYNKFKFAVAIHFLEHVSGFDVAREILYSALYASEEFVYVIEPFFDLDAELLKKGLKTYYSDWSGHKNLLNSLQFYRLGRDFLESNLITSFVIFGVEPIETSASPFILPLNAPTNSHDYNEVIHSAKDMNIQFTGLYKDICVFFLKNNRIPVEEYLKKRSIEYEVIYDSRVKNPTDEPSIKDDNLISVKDVLYQEEDYYIENNISEIDLIENIRSHMQNNNIDSYDDIFQILKQDFVNQNPLFKNDSFKTLKKLIKDAIIEYKQYDKIMATGNKNSREFFEYILLSIKSYNYDIMEQQSKCNVDIPVTVIIYVQDNNTTQLNNIYNSIVRQSFGIEHLEVLFVDNNSSKHETIDHLNQMSDIYHNVKYVRLDNNYSKADALNIAVKKVSTQYMIFTDRFHILHNSAIKDIFRAIRKDNMNLALGRFSRDKSQSRNSIYAKLYKSKFIHDNNIKFTMNEFGECVFSDDVFDMNGILETDINVTKK